VLEQIVLALPDLNQAAQLARALAALLALGKRGLKRRDADKTLERRQQVDGVERLPDEGVGAGGDGAHAGFLRAADRHDRHRFRLQALAQAFEVEDAVDASGRVPISSRSASITWCASRTLIPSSSNIVRSNSHSARSSSTIRT
jgi:hypothetical protein